jgi:hypothetical protein
MAMGREVGVQPPATAGTGSDSLARPERTNAVRAGGRSKLWWNVAWLLFFSSFFFCYYAIEDRNAWLWVGMLSALGTDLAIAMTALRRADREFGQPVEPNWRGPGWRV